MSIGGRKSREGGSVGGRERGRERGGSVGEKDEETLGRKSGSDGHRRAQPGHRAQGTMHRAQREPTSRTEKTRAEPS